tara:strand:- start:1121 stop:1540 length:420 start_codon:yes stop_codon:yes gene_type:complete
MDIPRFHIAFPVDNLENAKDFYTKILGCSLGRESDKWIDFNLYGHQIVAHFSPEECIKSNANKVDDDMVPCRHFGVILPLDNWEALGKKIKKKKVKFMIKPKIRFKNLKGEQGTFFLWDPSGNVLEFKSFKNESMVFEK